MSDEIREANKARMAQHYIAQYQGRVASELAAPSGSAAVIVAEGYYRLKAENERLREWIRREGVRTDACTYDVLGELCEGCRCKRYYAKQGYGNPPKAEVSDRRAHGNDNTKGAHGGSLH